MPSWGSRRSSTTSSATASSCRPARSATIIRKSCSRHSRLPAMAGNLECLEHDFRMMVADRAGRQLDAVADDVVLERLEPQDGIPVVDPQRQELLDFELRHGEE